MSVTAVKHGRNGHIDPYLDPFTDVGRTVRDRQVATAVRLRREGHTWTEIGRALFPELDGEHREERARIFVRSREPKLLADTKQWALARRARLLAQLERDEVGPRVFLCRVRAVVDAQHAGDLNVMVGSLNDVAASAIAWAQWLRAHQSRS